MKKILVVLFLLLNNHALVNAQELSVAALTESKSNAEWLRSATEQNTIPITMSESDLKDIKKVIRRLKVGRGMTYTGFTLTPILFTGGVITTFQGAFTRMPAHRRLSNLIKRKFHDTLFLQDNISDLNLRHLLKAKQELDKAQKVSYVAMGLTIINTIVTAHLFETTGGWKSLDYLFIGIMVCNFSNGIASYINLGYSNNAIDELSQIR